MRGQKSFMSFWRRGCRQGSTRWGSGHRGSTYFVSGSIAVRVGERWCLDYEGKEMRSKEREREETES